MAVCRSTGGTAHRHSLGAFIRRRSAHEHHRIGGAGFIGRPVLQALNSARRDRHHRGGRSHRRRKQFRQPGGRRYRRVPGPERLPRASPAATSWHGPRCNSTRAPAQAPGKQGPTWRTTTATVAPPAGSRVELRVPSSTPRRRRRRRRSYREGVPVRKRPLKSTAIQVLLHQREAQARSQVVGSKVGGARKRRLHKPWTRSSR